MASCPQPIAPVPYVTWSGKPRLESWLERSTSKGTWSFLRRCHWELCAAGSLKATGSTREAIERSIDATAARRTAAQLDHGSSGPWMPVSMLTRTTATAHGCALSWAASPPTMNCTTDCTNTSCARRWPGDSIRPPGCCGHTGSRRGPSCRPRAP